jgi:hypothetical protein
MDIVLSRDFELKHKKRMQPPPPSLDQSLEDNRKAMNTSRQQQTQQSVRTLKSYISPSLEIMAEAVAFANGAQKSYYKSIFALKPESRPPPLSTWSLTRVPDGKKSTAQSQMPVNGLIASKLEKKNRNASNIPRRKCTIN